MFPEYVCEKESFEAGLDLVVEAVLELSGIHAPPVDAFAVAHALGIAVAWDDRQSGRARYVRLSDGRSGVGQAAILLRPDPRPERRQWAVAHEIGEHMACHVFARWGVDPEQSPPNAREMAANHLAGRLLAPTEWLSTDGAACDWDLFELKARYPTASHELLARRTLECGPPAIVSIVDERQISFRRSNMPGRVPPPSPIELECWRDVHEHNRPSRICRGAVLVQGWPVHEEAWKREFLRFPIDPWNADSSEELHCGPCEDSPQEAY